MTETIKIDGMTCGGCVNSVARALARIGLEHADVKLGEARVEYDETTMRREQIVEAIEDAGFDVVAL